MSMSQVVEAKPVMDESLESAMTIPGIGAKISARKGDHSVTALEHMNDVALPERESNTCSVRYDGFETMASQPSISLGTSRFLSSSMRGNSLFEVASNNEHLFDEDVHIRKATSSDILQISRCGSWPGVQMDNIEALYDCAVSISTVRKSLEIKDNGGMSSHQRSSKYVEAVSRTFSRRSRRASPTSSSDHSTHTREKAYRKWMKLIKTLRIKSCTAKLLEGIKGQESEHSNEENEGEPNVTHNSVDASIVAKEHHLQQRSITEKNANSVDSSNRCARFMPISVSNCGRLTPLAPVRIACGQVPDSAVVRNGLRMDNKPLNYELIRIRYAGAHTQVYDCIEKETGKPLSVKIMPKNHKAAAIYEQLCLNPQPGFVRVLQVLEDKMLLYILMDFEDGKYLSELYQTRYPGITSSMLKAIVKSILRALAYIHRKKMVHGGVDMDSIAICELKNGEPVAKLVHVDTIEDIKLEDCRFSKQGAFKAPELTKGIITCSSDLWSLGVILYMFVEGKPPYRHIISNGPGKFCDTLSPVGVYFSSEKWLRTPEMKDFCLRCLQIDHKRRIASAMEALIHHWLK